MKIGFIDYYLDEWHANHYPEWLKEASDEPIELYAWAQMDGKLTTEEWCKTYGATRCGSIREVCEKCDGIMVLAPDNPETHLAFAQQVLPFGKPVFMDKTFAPDTKTAERIFEIAGRFGTPLFSSSSLRFADEFQPYAGKAEQAICIGGGHNFDVEIIHPVEICQTLMGPGAVRCLVSGDKDCMTALLDYADGRRATICFDTGCHGMKYTAVVNTKEDRRMVFANSAFFPRMIDSVISFFKGGVIPVDAQSTLDAMRIHDGLLKAVQAPDSWIDL